MLFNLFLNKKQFIFLQKLIYFLLENKLFLITFAARLQNVFRTLAVKETGSCSAII